MWVGGQRDAPTALPPWKEIRCPLYRRLGGSQGRSGRVRKFSPSPVFDYRTVQPVAGRYTDWAIAAHIFRHIIFGGQVIHTVKYADDLVLLAKEEKVLQDMIDKLIEIGRCYGMEMNVEKQK